MRRSQPDRPRQNDGVPNAPSARSFPSMDRKASGRAANRKPDRPWRRTTRFEDRGRPESRLATLPGHASSSAGSPDRTGFRDDADDRIDPQRRNHQDHQAAAPTDRRDKRCRPAIRRPGSPETGLCSEKPSAERQSRDGFAKASSSATPSDQTSGSSRSPAPHRSNPAPRHASPRQHSWRKPSPDNEQTINGPTPMHVVCSKSWPNLQL